MALPMRLVLVTTLELHVLVSIGSRAIKRIPMTDTTLARDSYKDEAIVCTFLVLTGGLVLSAALKPYYKRWRSVCGKMIDNRCQALTGMMISIGTFRLHENCQP